MYIYNTYNTKYLMIYFALYNSLFLYLSYSALLYDYHTHKSPNSVNKKYISLH